VLAITLKVDPLLDTLLPKDVMAASHSLLEPEMKQQVTEIIEPDVCVTFAFENPLQKLARPHH
jgi:hypothetical protein